MPQRLVLPIHGQDHCPGGPDPIPCLESSADPWVAFCDGATTAASGTWMPVPLATVAYDPDLVVPGDIFSWVTTDFGDVGNPRFELRTHVNGWYEFDLVTGWDQTTTGGTLEHGFAVQEMRFTPGINSPFSENRFFSSADWLDFDIHPNFEMVVNTTLHTGRRIYIDVSTQTWQPRAQQITGATRGLSGVLLYVRFLGADNDSNWTFDFV